MPSASTAQEATATETATIAEVTLKILLEATDGSAVAKITDQATTANGSVAYVLKLSRSQYSKKLKEAVAFVPRRSHFDIENEHSSTNEFRGFFTLFWILLFIFTVHTYNIRSIEKHGVPLNLRFATMFSKDARMLALSDAMLVLSTGICAHSSQKSGPVMVTRRTSHIPLFRLVPA
ncbi:hypothetical protein EDB83DRAFT_2520433 [Lactarius deliciosus]|nr:hypothetical protein EDB83DRAFT_2520433 [Lactarius deliciosus]